MSWRRARPIQSITRLLLFDAHPLFQFRSNINVIICDNIITKIVAVLQIKYFKLVAEVGPGPNTDRWIQKLASWFEESK